MENIYFAYCVRWRQFVVKLKVMSNAHAAPSDGYSECGYTKAIATNDMFTLLR